MAQAFRDIDARGVQVIASNSDTPVTRKLYEGFTMHQVMATRSVNSKGDKRGAVPELIILGRYAV